jgi:hypothetical protein
MIIPSQNTALIKCITETTTKQVEFLSPTGATHLCNSTWNSEPRVHVPHSASYNETFPHHSCKNDKDMVISFRYIIYYARQIINVEKKKQGTKN